MQGKHQPSHSTLYIHVGTHCICTEHLTQCGSSLDGEELPVDPKRGSDGGGWLLPGDHSSGGRALTKALSSIPGASM